MRRFYFVFLWQISYHDFMNLENLDKILEGEPKYRKSQINEAIFKDLIENWDNSLNLPLNLREKLKKDFPLEIHGEIKSSDEEKALKAVIALGDGEKIETVLMRHNGHDGQKRNTVCVSSQVGCPLKCEFCATGEMGFKRNLTKWEIVNQVLFFARILKDQNERVSNVVFMGMGEPFLNYENVLSAIRMLNDEECLNIAARKISISTSGIIPGIENLAKENSPRFAGEAGLQVNLAVSLHAPNDSLRSKLMPINKTYPLAKVLESVQKYIEKTSRKVMFEYVLLKGINDTKECAEELAKIMGKYFMVNAIEPLYFVNLISYNSTGAEGFEPSPLENIKKFKSILEKAGVEVSERYRFGRNIKAACGQLGQRTSY